MDHGFFGGQQSADLERVEHIKTICPHMYINLEPGKWELDELNGHVFELMGESSNFPKS